MQDLRTLLWRVDEIKSFKCDVSVLEYFSFWTNIQF